MASLPGRSFAAVNSSSDVSLNNKSVSNALRWIVCLAGGLLFFYEFMQLNILNPIDSLLMTTFSINAEQLGKLSSMYFWGNFLMVFPAGLLLDRLSTRRIILTAMVVCTISTFLFATAKSLEAAQFYRFLTGMGGGFCFLSAIRLATRWFKPHELAFITGCVVTMAMLGGMMAQTPMEMLVAHVGWRKAMILNGCLGMILTFIIWCVVKDRPPHHEQEENLDHEKLYKLGFWHSIRMVIFNLQNWLAGLYTSLLNLPIFLLGALWGAMFLVQVDHFTAQQASYITSMLFIGTTIGSPVIGWISDHFKRRRLLMIIGALISLAVILTIIYIPYLSLLTLMALFFALGFITSSQIISYPTIAELNPSIVAGSAISIVSLTIMASGFLSEPFFGWLMDLHWKHTFINNVAIYSNSDFRMAMLTMPIAFIVALIISLFIKETYAQSQVTEEGV